MFLFWGGLLVSNFSFDRLNVNARVGIGLEHALHERKILQCLILHKTTRKGELELHKQWTSQHDFILRETIEKSVLKETEEVRLVLTHQHCRNRRLRELRKDLLIQSKNHQVHNA